jgi:hypothetical protein
MLVKLTPVLFQNSGDNYEGATSDLNVRTKCLKMKEDSLEIIDYGGGEEDYSPAQYIPGDISTDDELDDDNRRKQV